jgi:hypothetical protein
MFFDASRLTRINKLYPVDEIFDHQRSENGRNRGNSARHYFVTKAAKKNSNAMKDVKHTVSKRRKTSTNNTVKKPNTANPSRIKPRDLFALFTANIIKDKTVFVR